MLQGYVLVLSDCNPGALGLAYLTLLAAILVFPPLRGRFRNPTETLNSADGGAYVTARQFIYRLLSAAFLLIYFSCDLLKFAEHSGLHWNSLLCRCHAAAYFRMHEH